MSDDEGIRDTLEMQWLAFRTKGSKVLFNIMVST